MTTEDRGGTIEAAVARHYGHGTLAAAIDAGLRAAGKDPERLRLKDLAPIDEFHIGGAVATEALFAQVAPASGDRWLDLGSGLGGPARHLAARYGCDVTGIDLTDDYVRVATELTRRTGLADRVRFRQGSVLDLPFGAGAFDGACLLHVGMNIADKARLATEVARVLRPGGRFVIFDNMRVGPGEPHYPLPWSTAATTSFVATVEVYRAALLAAGFTVVAERRRGEFGIAFIQAMRARFAESGPPPLGLQTTVMHERGPEKMSNLLAAFEAGLYAPVELIAERG